VADLKYRLGLDAPQLLPTFDWGSLGTMVRGSLAKVKYGLHLLRRVFHWRFSASLWWFVSHCC
jgi:hypothetical protein